MKKRGAVAASAATALCHESLYADKGGFGHTSGSSRA